MPETADQGIRRILCERYFGKCEKYFGYCEKYFGNYEKYFGEM